MDNDFFNIKEQTRANTRLSTKDANNFSLKEPKKNPRLSFSPASSKQNRNCKNNKSNIYNSEKGQYFESVRFAGVREAGLE